MGVSIRTIAGQLPDTAGTLYTVPAGIKAYVKSVSVFNTGGAPELVVLYLTIDGVTATVASPTLATLESLWLENVALKGGDTIDGETTTASTVDYTIQVVEDNE